MKSDLTVGDMQDKMNWEHWETIHQATNYCKSIIGSHILNSHPEEIFPGLATYMVLEILAKLSSDFFNDFVTKEDREYMLNAFYQTLNDNLKEDNVS